MTVRRWINLIVSALLILALILYFVPLPKPISVQLPGAEVDKDGNIIALGEIVLEGIYFSYLFQKDRFRLEHLELPNVESITPVPFSNGDPTIMDGPLETDDFIWTNVAIHIPDRGESDMLEMVHFTTIFTRPDFKHFLLSISQGDSSMYYIGTEEPSPVYRQILEGFYIVP